MSNHEQALADYDKQSEQDAAARQQAWESRWKFTQAIDAFKKDNPTATSANSEQLRQLQEAETAATKEYRAFYKAESERQRQHGHDFVFKILTKGNQNAIAPESSHLSELGEKERYKANQFLTRVVGAKWGNIPAETHALPVGSNRAYASNYSMYTTPDVPAWTIVHEFGHILEHHANLEPLSRAVKCSARC